MYHDKDRDECKKHSSLSDHLPLLLRQYCTIKTATSILQFGLDPFGRKQDAGLAGGVGQTALHIADIRLTHRCIGGKLNGRALHERACSHDNLTGSS